MLDLIVLVPDHCLSFYFLEEVDYTARVQHALVTAERK